MTERPSIAPKGEGTRLRAAIVGGGQACVAILKLVQDDALSHLRMKIMGVADVDPDRPGVVAAREQGVPLVTTDYRELYQIEGLDLIIEVTGKTDIRDDVEWNRPRNVGLIDHVAARLFWEVHQAQQAVIQQRTAMREHVEEEHHWIAQVFDSIPDEIVVLDLDQVVRDANAAFLKNNDLAIGDVQGCHCYEVDQGVRGECRVAVEDCPFFTAVKKKKPVSIVRKHYDTDGRARYAAIVAGPILTRDHVVVGVVEMTRDITGRIRLEQELKVKEVQLQEIVDHAPLAVYVKNRQGQYLQVNSATCAMFGKRRREIIGRTDREIFDRELADRLRQGDGEVLDKGTNVSFDMNVDLPSGRAYYLSTVKFPLFDRAKRVIAVCGLSRDDTAQREVEAALALTREYLQNIVDHSPVIIITTDLDTNVVSFNRCAELALGYGADEVVGQPAAMFYRDAEERELLLRRINQGDAVREYDTVLLKKDGSELPVSIAMSELKDSTGRMLGTVGMSRDISHRKALLNQIIQSERLAAVGRLAAGVAHEINNPLAVIGEIGGFLTDLVEGTAETDHAGLLEALTKWLPKLNDQVKRGRSVTHRMLRFGRKIEAEADVVNVNDALDEMLPFIKKEANLTNVVIDRHYQADLPPVWVEEMQLQEIFLNLLGNAIQALKGQGSGKIKLTTKSSKGKVKIQVRDNGPGIPEEIKDRLFDPFVTTKPPGQGTGLGLSICYAITKRYDGEIRVESKPGKGATFTVILPAWVEPTASPNASVPAAKG